jgi:hypothetical protein
MREEPGQLSLRASSDHRFIVGALRAKKMAGCSLIPLLIVRVPGAQGLAMSSCFFPLFSEKLVFGASPSFSSNNTLKSSGPNLTGATILEREVQFDFLLLTP